MLGRCAWNAFFHLFGYFYGKVENTGENWKVGQNTEAWTKFV